MKKMTDITKLAKRLRFLSQWQTAFVPSEPEDHIAWVAADALEAQAKEIEEAALRAQDNAAEYVRQIKDARIAELETALVDVTACLVAAVSLLERGGKKAAPSNKMFDQMIVDYKNCIERSRAALKGEWDD